MPRSTGQKHYHWDIDDPHQRLVIPKRMVQQYQWAHDLTLPKLSLAESAAQLIEAGYAQFVSNQVPRVRRNTRKSGTGKVQAA